MHPIIKSVLGIKEYPPKIVAQGVRAHENYKRFVAVSELLGLGFKEFNNGYQIRCFNKEKRLDYYPTTGRATWTGSNEFFDIDEIKNFLFINFKN